ncbi:ABC-2 type transport system permease protein [Pedobacter cryoconitis]|uniref:ABC-2 type transport system permease protein n=1 Tax=Pedobacter cryoconitis TaxID=188932 RepID=A0A7W8ZQW1_9SPHI|nr:ABC transporter permease subunit [Pedobacter cryoconitis]MBB5638551.1 ABC-2 type transport system permease protein [Pedobacter cryoconitis]
MHLFKLIFHFEWRQFLRQPAQLITLLFFFFMGLYSLHNGYHFVERQTIGLDTLSKNQQAHLQELISRFDADTTKIKGKILASQAGLPQVIEFRASPAATNPPDGLALMAIGQRDILPYFDIINSKRDILTPPNAEIANPEKLASGNFDFSFVLIYLFPLLIIILSYDLFSKEAEQQTDRLLTVQSGEINRILGHKLLFRLLLISLLTTLLSLTGFFIHPYPTALHLPDVLLWMFIIQTYLLFWFSICWLIIVQRKSSRINALTLLGIWLFLLLILPAMTNKIAALKHPVPLRTELVSSQRETMLHTWEMPIPQLLKEFYKNNPRYLPLKSTADTAIYGNKRFVAYYDLLGRRMNKNVNIYKNQAESHNNWLSKMAWFNPVAQMQSLLNATAKTGLSDYIYYQQQVTLFQNQWVKLMNGYLLSEKKLTVNEVKNLPVFNPAEDKTRSVRILINSLSIWLAILLILLLSNKTSK